MPKSRIKTKEYRWEVLDELLGQGMPLTQNQIFDAYGRKGLIAKVDVGFLPSFQKDIALFKKKLEEVDRADMLVVDRVQDGVDNRYRRYYYREKGYSIMPILTGGMSDSEYHHLVSAINKLKGTVSDETFEEVLFAIKSRVESDYQKGPVYVDYEDNRRLKGREYRPLFYRAMTEKQVLHIHYKTFKGEELEYDFHPYLLKQYNERWFAFGWSQPFGSYTSIPLDRLEKRPSAIGHYSECRPDNYLDFFNERVGVSNNLGVTRKRRIDLSVHSIDAWGRITTKPLPTQIVISDFDAEKQVGFAYLDIVPNREFYSILFSLGPDVEVISPIDVREYVLQQIMAFKNLYENVM